MKTMERNKQSIYYSLYLGREPVLDAQGRKTGEHINSYAAPAQIRVSVSPAMGYAQSELFGTAEQYDKIIISDDIECPISENTVLFIDKDPTFDEFGVPKHDFIVRRVAKSLNHIAYAVSKVDVS